jgi:hypothetical protein
MVVVVVDVVVVGVGAGTVVVVVEVVGVRPLGPDGLLVSQPVMTAQRRTPAATSLRIALALSDRSALFPFVPRAPSLLARRSNRDRRPA